MSKYTVQICRREDGAYNIRSFTDTYANYLRGAHTNSDYGMLFLETFAYKECEFKRMYDNWEPNMETAHRVATLTGKINDIMEFLCKYLEDSMLPGKIVGAKYLESQIPAKYLEKYSKGNLSNFYVKAGENGHILQKKGKPLFRFSEYFLPEALPVKDCVEIISVDGKYINEFQDDSRYGYISVSSEVFCVDNGNLEVVRRHAYIKGEVKVLNEILAECAIDSDYKLPGRIIVQEYEESKVPSFIENDFFNDSIDYEQQAAYYLKRGGEDIELISENSERILSFPLYVLPSSTHRDLNVQHMYNNKLEEWRREQYKSDNVRECIKREEDYWEDTYAYNSEREVRDWDYGDAFENDPSNLWNID
ncbi:hypothetical protein K3G39_20160 [Pontibacter sp. HSC-14F20]|uniref:hypothetical protein n=1 Tax=Pontibacter sp. HSC-14F20 TaxID=2864136 RepID=UPI001C72AAF2|nr:hypothetical protein [Pontibacter sp. HSC-14F20]MBX0335552.1 hypothetical protein [Pontibacter sp. HSC-14F20]